MTIQVRKASNTVEKAEWGLVYVLPECNVLQVRIARMCGVPFDHQLSHDNSHMNNSDVEAITAYNSTCQNKRYNQPAAHSSCS